MPALSERERAVYRRARGLGITVKREKGVYRYFNYTHEVSGYAESLDRSTNFGSRRRESCAQIKKAAPVGSGRFPKPRSDLSSVARIADSNNKRVAVTCVL